MELTIIERLLLLNNLASEGDIIYLRARRELVEKLQLTDDEVKKYAVVMDQETGKVKWNPDVPQKTQVELTDAERNIIKDTLARMNREHKLTADHIDLYEKFVE